MGLAADFRHKYILDELRASGKVVVRQIAQALEVTEVTVRRDLTQLESSGLLKKTYGGAVLMAPEVNPSVRFRQTRNLTAKRTIGELSAKLVNEGDSIWLEAGSTCYEIIPHLAQKQNLTIITNSLYLMRRLHEMSMHRIIIIGGEYRPGRMDMVGLAAETAISQLSGFKAFTGADDIAIQAGISGADVVTVGLAKMVLQKASEVIFVGDSTKFDKPALYKIADIDALDYIVTNTAPTKAWHRAAKNKNIRLLYPGYNG